MIIQQQNRAIIINGYADTQDTSREQLAEWSDVLTYISYYSYGFTLDGVLIPALDSRLIQYAYDLGVAPLMVLTPFNELGEYSYDLLKELFTDPYMRDQLINQIVLTVMEKNYYGVVFNFGYIAPEDKEQFVITVSKTASRLNRRAKLVIVSLNPGIDDLGIDYSSLGKVANFIELRTFSWESISGPPSPIDSIEQNREMLNYITARVDPNKILLGIPNFGLDWTLPYVADETTAQIISNVDAVTKAELAGATIQYNNIAQSSYYRYVDDKGREHEVWFYDQKSIESKLALINEYGLAGISIWMITNPFPTAIEIINKLFTEVYKIDI